jgi:hypothetical protein
MSAKSSAFQADVRVGMYISQVVDVEVMKIAPFGQIEKITFHSCK